MIIFSGYAFGIIIYRTKHDRVYVYIVWDHGASVYKHVLMSVCMHKLDTTIAKTAGLIYVSMIWLVVNMNLITFVYNVNFSEF